MSTFCSLFDVNYLSLTRISYEDFFVLIETKWEGKCPKLRRSGSVLVESLSLYESRFYKNPYTRKAAQETSCRAPTAFLKNFIKSSINSNDIFSLERLT